MFKSKVVAPKKCKICDTEFVPIRKSQEFCKLECYNKSRILSKQNTALPAPEAGTGFIPLTQGKFVKVDEDCYDELSKYNWFLPDPTPEEEAAKAYDAKLRKVVGQFGRYNFSQDGE
jgi:hypothetical protein